MESKIKKIVASKAVIFTFLSAMASGINFLTLILFGRVFSVEDYATITTLQAFVANVAVVMTPLQIMICKEISTDYNRRKEDRGIISILLVASFLELIFFGVGYFSIVKYLHLSGIVEYILFVLLVAANNAYIILTGVVQGKQDFVMLGITGILMYGLKLVISIVLGVAGLGPIAVVVGFGLSEFICVAIILLKMFRLIRGRHIVATNFDKDIFISYIWSLVLYLIVSLYMNNGDLLLGNFYCSRQDIGLYSVAINLAKISVFLIATPIATILLPKVSASIGKRDEQRKLLIFAECITFVVSAIYGVIFYLLGGWFIGKIYGPSYSGASDYIFVCVVFSTVLGMFWVFYQFAFATDLMKSFTIITACVGVVVFTLVLFFKPSLYVIPCFMIVAMIFSSLGVLVVNSKK